MASAVTTTPPGSRGSSRTLRAGISLDLPATRSWVSTAPVAWSKAARRCGAGSSPVRAPRMVLPSTAITVRPLMVPVRVHNHALSSASRSAGSRSCRTRRIVDSDGRAWPASTPKDRRSAPVRSVVCSHIAVRLRQPASTPVMARDSTVGRSWRTPRRSLGSATFLRTWTRGWRDKAVVVEDDIGGVTSLVTGLSRRLHRHRAGHAAPTSTRQTH